MNRASKYIEVLEIDLENKCRGVTVSMWELGRALGSGGGLNHSLKIWIYDAFLKPSLTYTAEVWRKGA